MILEYLDVEWCRCVDIWEKERERESCAVPHSHSIGAMTNLRSEIGVLRVLKQRYRSCIYLLLLIGFSWSFELYIFNHASSQIQVAKWTLWVFTCMSTQATIGFLGDMWMWVVTKTNVFAPVRAYVSIVGTTKLAESIHPHVPLPICSHMLPSSLQVWLQIAYICTHI